MTAKAMDGLWAYLQTLSLTKKNREWLSARLIEPETQTTMPPEIAAIPPQYRVDPYLVSPSGDPYWADRRNVEALEKSMEELRDPNTELLSFSSVEELAKYIDAE